MPTLEQVNKDIYSFRTSEFRWVRELTASFEKYWNKNFKDFLIDLEFQEFEVQNMFLYTLFNMKMYLMSSVYFIGGAKTSFGRFLQLIAHTFHYKNVTLNEERIENLFISFTMPWWYFRMKSIQHKIDYYKLTNDKNKLEESIEHQKILERDFVSKEKVWREVLNKLADKQEKERRKIENMAESYMETCEKCKTYKPSNLLLSEISGVKERVWVEQRRNEIFLKYLMGELKKKYNQQKNPSSEEFWWNVIEYIDKKIEFISDPDGFLEKINKVTTLNEETYNEKPFAKSKGKMRMAEQNQKENADSYQDNEGVCDICGDYNDGGSLCKDCQEEFRTV